MCSSTHLEIRSVILGDVRTVALRQHHDLLLYVLDLILRLLEIDDLDGDDLLSPVVDAFEDLAEATLPDSFLFRKYQLGVHLLQQRSNDRRLLLFVIRHFASLSQRLAILFPQKAPRVIPVTQHTVTGYWEIFRDSFQASYAFFCYYSRPSGINKYSYSASAAMQFSLAPFYGMTHDVIMRIPSRKRTERRLYAFFTQTE